MVLTSWIIFTQFAILHLVLLSVYHTLVLRDPGFSYEIGVLPIWLLFYAKYQLIGWITCFALFEKIGKEKFVINYTNE
jgi:hypothetical protein